MDDNQDNMDNQTQDQEPSWKFSDDLPGTGEKPEWFKDSKYKTVADQAKAYTSLESKLGSFTGAPEEYEVSVPGHIKERGIDFDSEDPVLQEAFKFAKESNMSQDGFNSMLELYATSKIAEAEAIEAYKMQELKSLGDNYQDRLNNLSSWAQKNLDAELIDGFNEMAQSASAVQAMEKIIAMTRSESMNPNDSGSNNSTTSEELKAMQFEKDEFGNRRISSDPEFRARYNKLKQEVWGTEPHKIMIGG